MAKIQIDYQSSSLHGVATPLLVLPAFERGQEPPAYAAELDRRLDGMISRLFLGGDFRGRAEQAALLYPPSDRIAAERILLVGCGTPSTYTAEVLRRVVGVGLREAERLSLPRLAISLDHDTEASEHLGTYVAARSAAEAAALAAWSFREFKTAVTADQPVVEIEALTLVGGSADTTADGQKGAREGAIVGHAANLARELATRPGNQATPSFLAEVARGIAERHGLGLTVLDREQMQEQGLHAVLAVARGTQEPPRFLVLEYQGGAPGAPPLALVGKGVTFDSGGISIKPADRMEEMKSDMSGAAAVLSALDAIAELRLPVNVVAVTPATENLPSGTALKPGDVIGTLLGKTIEVINTDAEGRLILADALAYAARYQPAAIVDVATLTGAVVVALGNHAIGLMGNDQGVVDELRAAGERTGERCWPLPLWDEYRKQIDSDIADIKNSAGRAGGTITAGCFLREFVGDTPWAHLDIAATAWRTEGMPSYLRKGATGVPVRLLVEWVRSRARS